MTGASGFVGSHVLRALVARGATDIVAAGRTPPADAPDAVCHVALDITTATAADYERLGRPDMLVHLAWGGLPNYLSLHHFEEELPAHYRFLSAMVGAGLPAMLVTGTCYEYGMVDGALEESRVPAPANPYAYAKVALLTQLHYLRATSPFALTWARLFYTWGARQARSSIFPLLEAAIARGDATFPMSRGEQLRDYLPITDVAGILGDLALRGGDAGVVNVSSGEPIAIRTLVERWIAERGADITPDLGRYPYPSYEPLAFWGSNVKRRAVLAH